LYGMLGYHTNNENNILRYIGVQFFLYGAVMSDDIKRLSAAEFVTNFVKTDCAITEFSWRRR